MEERDWLPVEFLSKPGSRIAPPKAVSPSFHIHMLRLDWLIWFLSFKIWVLLISILVNHEDIVLG